MEQNIMEQNIIENIDRPSCRIVATIHDKIKLLLKITTELNTNDNSRKEIYKKIKDLINFDFDYAVAIRYRTDLSIEIQSLSGGDNSSDKIATKIHKLWNESNEKVIIKNNEGINLFEFNKRLSKDKSTLPLLAKGTYTAVYLINKLSNNNEYILRAYDKENPHMYDNEKIKTEYNLFNDYLIKVYYYGVIKVDLDNSFIYDYVITKTYNTKKELRDVLTNKQKFLYIKNIVILLDKLYNNGYYWNDLKIDNVGWEDDKKMNPIMIDYDSTTIEKFDEEPSGSATYLPKYKYPRQIDGKDSYDKFSIAGLWDIFRKLDIQLKVGEKKYKNSKVLSEKEIKFTTITDLLSVLKIDGVYWGDVDDKEVWITKKMITEKTEEEIAQIREKNRINKEESDKKIQEFNDNNKYEDIPTYKEILKILEWLESNNYIA